MDNHEIKRFWVYNKRLGDKYYQLVAKVRKSRDSRDLHVLVNSLKKDGARTEPVANDMVPARDFVRQLEQENR